MHANSSKSRALAVPQALDMQRAVVMFVNGDGDAGALHPTTPTFLARRTGEEAVCRKA